MNQLLDKAKQNIKTSLTVAFFAGMVLIVILAKLGLADGIQVLGINIPVPHVEVTREVIQTIEVTRVVEVTREPDTASSTVNLCENYGLKIISPIQGQNVSGEIVVEGTYENEPVKEEMLIFVVNRENNLIWPKSRDNFTIDPINQRWTWRGDLGLVVDSEAFVGIAAIGMNSHSLADYFEKVGREFGSYPGISKFTDDFQECDRVLVKG